MAIVSRILQETSAVAVARRALTFAEPQQVFAFFGESGAGARFLDDEALKIRVYTFPQKGLRLTCEPLRVRLESLEPKKPRELPLGRVLGDMRQALFAGGEIQRFGFNYDTEYRYDAVIPQREVLGAFMKEDIVDDVTHFGWQFTVGRERGARRETYYCKVISPLELRVMANVEFDGALESRGDLQALFERCAEETQTVVDSLSFS